VGPGGEPIGVANLNEFLSALPETTQKDEYVIHLCVRKAGSIASRSATKALPFNYKKLDDYGDGDRTKLGMGFPVCSAFLSRAANSRGEGLAEYFREIEPESGLWGPPDASTFKLFRDARPETRVKLSRVQGSIGCVNRPPGLGNQKILTRATYTGELIGKHFCSSCWNGAISKRDVDELYGLHPLISNVNIHGVDCVESRFMSAELAKQNKPKMLGLDDFTPNACIGKKKRAQVEENKVAKAAGRKANDVDNIGDDWHCTYDSLQVFGPEVPQFCGREKGFYVGYDDGGYAKHCINDVPPVNLWFQSSSCEQTFDKPMRCKSLTKTACDAPERVLDVIECDDENNKAVLKRGEAGYCTCIDENTEHVQPWDYLCNAHEETSCQDYCRGMNPMPAITDIVMVSSADFNGEPTCPEDYHMVQALSPLFKLDGNLNQGTNPDHHPRLLLCQTNKIK
jgi:hypothetical protein